MAGSNSATGDLQRVSGLVNVILAQDVKATVDMGQLSDKLWSESACLRESAKLAGNEGLTLYISQMVAAAQEPGQHTLGILHFLFAHLKPRHSRDTYALVETVDATLFFNTALQCLIDCPEDLAQRVLSVGKGMPDRFAQVCHMVAQVAVDLNRAADAIQPLFKACRLIADGEPILTPTHCEVVRLCLKTEQASFAVEKLCNVPIEAIHPKNTGLVSKDYLLYFYYGGLCYSAVKEWQSAVDFFTTCINTPADGLSSIVVEAHKYWTLVSLFLKEGPAPATAWKRMKSTPIPVTNYLEPANKLYVHLNKELLDASTGKAGTEVKCNRFIEENVAQFTTDNTIGLVRQAQQWIYQRRMQRLTFTYLTLSMNDIASVVGVEESTVAASIATMVGKGLIFAKVDGNMVTFLEDPQTYTGRASIAIMSERMQEVNVLAERVANMKAKVMVSKKYIEHAVIEDGRKAATAAAVAGGTGTAAVVDNQADVMDLDDMQ